MKLLTPGTAFIVAVVAIAALVGGTYALGRDVLDEAEPPAAVATAEPEPLEAVVVFTPTPTETASATPTAVPIAQATPQPTVRPTFGAPAFLPTVTPTFIVYGAPLPTPTSSVPIVYIQQSDYGYYCPVGVEFYKIGSQTIDCKARGIYIPPGAQVVIVPDSPARAQQAAQDAQRKTQAEIDKLRRCQDATNKLLRAQDELNNALRYYPTMASFYGRERDNAAMQAETACR